MGLQKFSVTKGLGTTRPAALAGYGEGGARAESGALVHWRNASTLNQVGTGIERNGGSKKTGGDGIKIASPDVRVAGASSGRAVGAVDTHGQPQAHSVPPIFALQQSLEPTTGFAEATPVLRVITSVNRLAIQNLGFMKVRLHYTTVLGQGCQSASCCFAISYF
jgi:hypothetical protein